MINADTIDKRVWCLTASMTVFQTDGRGSNPLTRSKF